MILTKKIHESIIGFLLSRISVFCLLILIVDFFLPVNTALHQILDIDHYRSSQGAFIIRLTTDLGEIEIDESIREFLFHHNEVYVEKSCLLGIVKYYCLSSSDTCQFSFSSIYGVFLFIPIFLLLTLWMYFYNLNYRPKDLMRPTVLMFIFNISTLGGILFSVIGN